MFEGRFVLLVVCGFTQGVSVCWAGVGGAVQAFGGVCSALWWCVSGVLCPHFCSDWIAKGPLAWFNVSKAERSS